MVESLAAIAPSASAGTTEETTVPSVRKRIGLLIAGHVVAGWAVCIFTGLQNPDLPASIYLTMFFAQAGLLGIGGVLATASRLRRFGAAVGGVLYLCICETLAADQGHDAWILALLILVTFGTVFSIVGVVRIRGAYLCRFKHGAQLPVSEALRFTIQHLLVLTTVVAVVLALLRWRLEFGENDTGVLVVIYGLSFTVCPLVAVWASLGLGRLIVRVPIALCLAVIPGFLPTLYFSHGTPLWFWPSITFMQGAIMVGSLLVVRSCGYRLVRRAGKAIEAGSEIEPIAAGSEQ